MAQKNDNQLVNNFFALLDDGNNSVRRIDITTDVIPGIRKIFTDGALKFKADGVNEVEFDGNYVLDLDETLFVAMEFPKELIDAAKSPLSTRVLNMADDKVKALFWYDNQNDSYYFQSFDNRRLLTYKYVLILDKKTYSKLEEEAFVVENNVDALLSDGKFYFISYANANKIFSLSAYFKAATAKEIVAFTKNVKVSLDPDWLIKKANSAVKKQITQLTNSGVLEQVGTQTIKSTAIALGMTINLDEQEKIIFPQDIKQCRELLEFLNQGRFKGVLTGELFATNSKRKLNGPVNL